MTTLRAVAITGQRRTEGMRLGEVSLTDNPAFGLAATATKRVANVPGSPPRPCAANASTDWT